MSGTRHPGALAEPQRPVNLSEFFYSIQGEGTHIGLPCTFVRLAECNLRCVWCDSKFSFKTALVVPAQALLDEVERVNCPLVELTGGEPLLQRPFVEDMARALLERGRRVLMETTLSMPMEGLDPRIVKIVDIKCPDSGMAPHMRYGELRHLSPKDEIKFVVASEEDFRWAVGIAREHGLSGRIELIFSPALGRVDPTDLANWVLDARLESARMQVQLHKFLATEVTEDKLRAHLDRMREHHPALFDAAITPGAASA